MSANKKASLKISVLRKKMPIIPKYLKKITPQQVF
jgi:hypothetical protein